MLTSLRRASILTRVLVAAVAALLLLTAAYAGYKLWGRYYVPQVEISGAVVEEFEVDGQEAMVIRGENTGPGAPLVLVTHGYNADERVTKLPYMAEFTQEAVDAGWIVASSEASGDAWGSAESVENYLALHEEVSEKYQVTDTAVVSLSMGAVSGLHLVSGNELDGVIGWFGVSPVTDLEAMSNHDDWGSRISEALTDAELAERDPANLDLSDTPPLFISNDAADEVTPTEAQSAPFVERTGAEFRECADEHVGPDCFPTVEALEALR